MDPFFHSKKFKLHKVLPNQQTNKKPTLSIPPMGGGITPHHPNGRGDHELSGVNCSDNFLLASGISSSISVFDIEPGSPVEGVEDDVGLGVFLFVGW